MKTLKFNNELNNFYILQLGQFLSEFGSKTTSFGLIMWAYEQSSSVMSTSALTLCTLLPSILLSFFAGSFIDRWNKKNIMLIANVIATIFSLITLILIFCNQLNITYLYLINFTLGVFYAFIGLKVIVIVDLFSFISSFILLLLFVHVPNDFVKNQDKKESFLTNCKQGLHYIIDRKAIFHLIIFMAFVNFISSIYSSNFAPMILSRNGNNKLELGMVSSTIGIAGIIGSTLVALIKQPKKRVPVIINTMIFSFLICNSMLGIGRTYHVWIIAVFSGNCLVPFLTANVEYIMRTKIPIEMQGRVFSARNTLQYFSTPMGYILGGILTDKILEPFMQKPSTLQQFFSYIVGNGAGAGNALIYIIIALIGFFGCCFFKFDKSLKSLDD